MSESCKYEIVYETMMRFCYFVREHFEKVFRESTCSPFLLAQSQQWCSSVFIVNFMFCFFCFWLSASECQFGGDIRSCQKQPPEVFCKKGVLRNFAKFTGKHLCQSLFLIKLQAGGTGVFLWILWNF